MRSSRVKSTKSLTLRPTSSRVRSSTRQSERKVEVLGFASNKSIIISDSVHDSRLSDTSEEEPEPDWGQIKGVKIVTLGTKSQNRFRLKVCDDVTEEKPWKYVDKRLLIKNSKDNTDLLAIQQDIINYKGDAMLFGYQVMEDDQPDYNDFYFCSTIEAEQEVSKLYEHMLEKRRKKLLQSIYKYPRPWIPGGSEIDVEEMNENQSYRPLYEIEIESKFPVFDEHTEFENRDADDVIDGYVDIIPTRETFDNTVRRRVGVGVQATPTRVPGTVQTICTFPTNQWTQYQYSYEVPREAPIIVKKGQPKPKTPLESFLNPQREEAVSDHLIYNSTVNLYSNDYDDLLRASSRQMVTEPNIEEFMSFADVNISDEKYVGSCCWHPMWCGIVAIAYVDAPNSALFQQKRKNDMVHRIVHGVNPVLIWSSLDSLHPKLEMEATREVTCLAFCPHDENILIGGCRNGQVIIWDITNRLEFVETTEILTTAQQKYRTTMKRMTKWFKNTKNDALVRPACVSDINFSHKRSVTHINWLPPQKRMTRLGIFVDVKDPDKNPSYQFMTSGEDGMFKVWDLKAIPEQAEEKRTAHFSRRLGKRLEELTVDISPYAILDRILKPIFEMSVSVNGSQNTPINSFIVPTGFVKYKKITNLDRQVQDFKIRDKFEPIIEPDLTPFPQRLQCSFVQGDIADCTWTELDWDPNNNDEVNHVSCTVTLYERFHGGPPFISQSPYYKDTFLSVGGKVFAVWKQGYYAWALYIQRRDYLINCGNYSLRRPSTFYLAMNNGTVEIWDMLNAADKPTAHTSVSGNSITAIILHIIVLPQPVMGLGDYRGTFRIFQIPKTFGNENFDSVHKKMHEQFQSAIERKTAFCKWKADWAGRNKDLVHRIVNEKLEAEAEKKAKEEYEEREREKKEEKEKEAAERRRLAESRPEPGKYSEWAQKKYDKMIARRMHNILLDKKHLKRADLVDFLAPLNRIEAEKKHKTENQAQLMKNKDKILDDAVAVLFPETLTYDTELESQSAGTIEAVESQRDEKYTTTSAADEDYENFESDILNNIKQNKYDSDFSWQYLITKGNERRKIIDYQLSMNTVHRARLARDIYEHAGGDVTASLDDIKTKSDDSTDFSSTSV